MTFKNLERYEKQLAEAKAAEAEAEKRRELRRQVRAAIPKSIRVPKRGRGRTPSGGLSRKELLALHTKAAEFLQGATGLAAFEAEVKQTAIVICLIDGVLGTQPWRSAGGPHAGLIAANARLRYLENALRILEDMRRSQGGGASEPAKLLEGVLDAEVTEIK